MTSTLPTPAERNAAPADRPAGIPPAVDLREEADSVVLTADMPGVPQSGIEVTVEGNVLSIRGRSAARAPERLAPVWREYRPADFERRFTLSEAIDRSAIAATCKDGVLTLTLPKRREARPRRLEVQTG